MVDPRYVKAGGLGKRSSGDDGGLVPLAILSSLRHLNRLFLNQVCGKKKEINKEKPSQMWLEKTLTFFLLYNSYEALERKKN